MKKESKQRLIRLVMVSGVFLLSWAVLVYAGNVLFDEQAIIKWLNETKWLKFLKPDHSHSTSPSKRWQLLAALAIGAFSYRLFKGPAEYFLDKISSRKQGLELRLDAIGFGLPTPEFMFILPGNPTSPQIVLKNHGPGPARIERIEIEPRIHRKIKSHSIESIHLPVDCLSLESQKNMLGLEWKKVSDEMWVLEVPFTVGENEKKSTSQFLIL